MVAVVGVGQWLLFSLGLDPTFRSIFHSMAQVQGFLGCFAAGFLLTFIPRRTMTGPAQLWQVVVCAMCPVMLCVFAWREQWALAQVWWLIEMGVLLQFVIGRAAAMRRPLTTPASLVWVPLGLGFGLIGAVLTAMPSLHALGKGLLLEGLMASLVMGIGAMLVPVVTRAEPPKPLTRDALILHGALAVAFAASFVIQAEPMASMRVGYGLRLVVASAVLVRGARLWVWPTEPGLNRRLVWFAAWCLPVGYLLLTLWPMQRSAGLHVIFIGGFSLLSMTIGHHVMAAHGGHQAWLQGWAKATIAMAAGTWVAMIARVMMQLDSANYLKWMTLAAVAFIASAGAWLLALYRMQGAATETAPAPGLRTP